VGRPKVEECNVPDKTSSTAATTTAASTTNEQTTASSTTAQPTGPWTEIRLPKALIPFHYDVDLWPILKPDSSGNYSFNGTSKVFFTVNETTDYIYIHANKLDISKVEVKDSSVSRFKI